MHTNQCKLLVDRVRIVKNELGGSAIQQKLRGWGSQWTEHGNWGVNPPPCQFEPTLLDLIIYIMNSCDKIRAVIEVDM